LEINLDEIFRHLPNKPLLSLFEVSQFLGLNKRTIYRWYPDILNGTNIHGVIRIYRISVVELVRDNHGKRLSDEDMAKIENQCKKTPRKNQSWVKNWSNK